MLAISGFSAGYSTYQSPYATKGARAGEAARQTQAARTAPAQGAVKAVGIPPAQPETPVQPVSAVPSLTAPELDRQGAIRRWSNDPAALAARSRIQYEGNQQPAQTTVIAGTPQAAEQTQAPGAGEQMTDPGTLQLGRSRGKTSAENSARGVELSGFVDAKQTILNAPDSEDEKDAPKVSGQKENDRATKTEDSKSPRETAEEGECQTCKNRKYQDGSDDPGVSFKTPTHIDPDQAASAVQGHEMEHVVRNQAQAQREGRRVVSQSVSYHTAICPECGRVYVSGGTTRTVTAADNKEDETEQMADMANKLKDKLIPGLDRGKEDEKTGFPGASSDKNDSKQAVPGLSNGKEDAKKTIPGLNSDKKDVKQNVSSALNTGKEDKQAPGPGLDSKETDKQVRDLVGALLNAS